MLPPRIPLITRLCSYFSECYSSVPVSRLIRPLAALMLALTLTGCSQDFAELQFNTRILPDKKASSSSAYRAPMSDTKLIYREQLDLLLISVGINPQQVNYRLVPPGEKVILSSTRFSGLPEKQKAALQARLEQHFQQRDQLLKVQFAVQKTGQAARQYTSDLRLRYLRLSLVPDPYLPLEEVRRQMQDVSRKRQLYCHLSIALNPALPFSALQPKRDAGGGITGYYLQPNTDAEQPEASHRVQIQFAAPALQAGLDSGQFSLMMPVSWRNGSLSEHPERLGKVDRLEIRLFALGEYGHEQPQLDAWSHNVYLKQCEQQLAGLNAPFNYAFGDSLDRLVKARVY